MCRELGGADRPTAHFEQLVRRYRWRPSFPDRPNERGGQGGVSLVLRMRKVCGEAADSPVPHRAPIVDAHDRALTEQLDTFLRKCPMTVAQVAYRRHRAVAESKMKRRDVVRPSRLHLQVR